MKKTKINKAHYTLKGKMVDFAGWDLPVQYSGLSKEHLAVRTTGGIFDVSHMGEIFFRGPQAAEAIQHLTSNNVLKLEPGKIQYSGLLTENGCFVDDLLVYMINDKEYMLVVNASNIEKDFTWIRKNSGQFTVDINNESENYSQIAVQGPNSEKLISEFTTTDLSQLKYYYFLIAMVDGINAIISRTGYTGEDGFEIYFIADEEKSANLFLKLAQAGEKYKIVPAGLGARDTLRLEAGMSLYGNDIDEKHTVLEAGLGWILKLKKGDFIGKEALQSQKQLGIKQKLAGFEIIDRGIARHEYPVYLNGREYSTVTSGTFAPFLKKAIGLTYLPIAKTEIGTEFFVGIRGRKALAKVIETPFYKRKN